MTQAEVARTGLIHTLVELGLKPGERFLVHSSLRMLGWIDGGADTVIDALRTAVTESGTVMMPAFTLPPAPIFDPKETPTSLGVISETFRRRPDVTRSIHPSHSVAVWGKDKDRYAAAHETSTALGVGSPVHLFLDEGADILLLGVGHWANSAVHVAEVIAGVPYLDIPYNDDYARPLLSRLPGGTIREFPPNENPGCSINFIAVQNPLKERGLITFGRLGDGLLQRIHGRGLLETVSDILRRDPFFVLCAWDLCPFCPRVRKRFAH